MSLSDDVFGPSALASGLGQSSRVVDLGQARRRVWQDRLNVLTVALLAGVGYYVGAELGLAFGFPATHMSVLWPPNVVLIVALLIAPRRMWWAIVVASLLAQLLAHVPRGAPVHVATLYGLGNAGQSLLTVILLQRFGGGAPRFDNFRSTAWFIGIAAVLVPALVSFLVAVVLLLIGWVSDFWLIWQSRFLTDALSTLTLVPLALGLLTSDLTRLRRVPLRRWLEVGLLVLGFVALGIGEWGARLPQLRSLPTLLYAPLPLFLWAGLRFGVIGVSIALLTVAASALWGASYQLGPFIAASPADTVLGLQLFLIELGLPLTLMAALVDERRVTVRTLRQSGEQVRTLAGKLITAQEQERAQIARELHDEVGQALTTVKINLDTLRLVGAADAGDAAALPALLDEGVALVDHALEQVRDLSLLLRPSLLDHLGLAAALRWLLDGQAQRVGYRATFTAAPLRPPPSPEMEIICYRVAQEALTNIARHARAREVSIDLRPVDGQLRLTVRDDGAGFDPPAMRQRARDGGSLGLLSLEERAKLGHGRLRLDSAPGRGTTLVLSLPWPTDA